MWLMALWPRRRLCRSPSTDRLPSSKRVRLLYDRFLEVDIKGEREGGGKKTVLCEVWKETTGCHPSKGTGSVDLGYVSNPRAFPPKPKTFKQATNFFSC